MQVMTTAIPDIKLIKPKVFGDDRGFFFESYNQKEFQALGIHETFVQDNHSRSAQGVLRGLHYQMRYPQGKLVRVTQGEVFDVGVDLRKSSPTFGKWFGYVLSAKTHEMLYIPHGFAHGFLVLSPSADFLYKTTAFYEPQEDRCLMWNDPDLAIQWPLTKAPLLSPKDLSGKLLKEAELYS